MVTPKHLERCRKFLFDNGWHLGESEGAIDDESFWREGHIAVDMNPREMVFIGDEGDFLHKPTDYYTLVGVMLEFRQLPINYKSISYDE